MRALRALLVLAVTLPWLLLASGPAQAQGPAAQGWWTEFHRSGLPALPAAPDVAADDLLLQGGDPARLLPNTGVVDQGPAPSAVAALRFVVRPGATVGALLLSVASGAQAMDVRAYPASRPWTPAQGGDLAEAPAPDLSRYSSGRLSADGTTLDFPDIGRLVTDQGLLSVVLVPGPADRVVVHHPASTALAVAAEPAPVEELVLAPVPPALAVAVLPRADLPVLQPAPAAGTQVRLPSVPQVVLPAPVAAPAPLAPVAQVVGRLVADDTRSRLLVLAEALLVITFFGLLGQGPLALLARAAGQLVQDDGQRGVGRFRTSRTGQAPRL